MTTLSSRVRWLVRVLKPGGSFDIWGECANLGNHPAPLKKSGLYFSQGIVGG